MGNVDCKICDTATNYVFEAKILNKYIVKYYQCPNCEFVQTEKPYWLKEAYENPMNYTDTGIMLRNKRLSRITTTIICFFFNKNSPSLDYAGGYGVFTRMMRDRGFDFYWSDPYTQNALARGFEALPNMHFEQVTTFESFEHFDEPMTEIKKIAEISKNIIFSTEPLPKTLPAIDDWWYYATEHGQHIAFYSTKTLNIIAGKIGVHYYNIGNVHFFSQKKLGAASSFFIKLPYAKHLLYILSAIVSLPLKSKTMEDMQLLKQRQQI